MENEKHDLRRQGRGAGSVHVRRSNGIKRIKQERDNTKREKQRADAAEARIRELEAQLTASGMKNKK